MYPKTLILAALSLLSVASAHFDVVYPPDRGDNSESQGTGPCGGLNTPSNTRTQWPLDGGRLQFKAGHDEAHTEVWLALGNDPKDSDFKVQIVPLFNQVGLGNFCWEKLRLPNGTSGVTDGANGTIQVKQGGHDGGWLYNCADITFSSSPPNLDSACKNDSGVFGEPVNGGGNDTGVGNSVTAAGMTFVGGMTMMAALIGFLGFI